jgi:glycosyltransferase involved in cell wall biosynthesis
MEILFITHKYPPSIGGMEKQSFELTERMKQHAVVHVLCCDGRESKVRFFAFLKRRIREKLRQHPGISVLHFNDGLAAAFCSGADDFPGLLRSVTLHGLDVVFPNAWFQQKILPRFNHFQSIIAVSRATAQACIQRGISPEKVIVISNGVDHDIAFFKPNDAEKQLFQTKYAGLFEHKITLLMMGRPVLRKGFSWFLQSVFPLLPADFQIVIIGPFRPKRPIATTLLYRLPTTFRKQLELLFGMPSDEDNLREILQQPLYHNRVRHLGKLPFTEILQIMSAAQAFLMPNIPVHGDMEGFGLVCLEANLRGLPVFAADLEGIIDAIQNNCNGLLLPTQNKELWLSALMALEQNPAAMHALGNQARQYVLDNFNWDTMVFRYYQHFEVLNQQHLRNYQL